MCQDYFIFIQNLQRYFLLRIFRVIFGYQIPCIPLYNHITIDSELLAVSRTHQGIESDLTGSIITRSQREIRIFT